MTTIIAFPDRSPRSCNRLTACALLLGILAPAAPLSAQPARAAVQPAPLDRSPLTRLTEQARGGTYGNVDHLLVLRDGETLLDERMPRDYVNISRGKSSPIGCGTDACSSTSPSGAYNYLDPRYHPFWNGTPAHTLQSVTKSVTATLIGIAQQRGEIKSMKSPLLQFFDGYHLPGVIDDRLRDATLADLLTMRSGIEWHESDRPLDETNTTLQLERGNDWIKFTLSQPMDAAPGAKWAYNSGGSQLMSEVVRRATGMHADKYAERYLFAPLGITAYHWKATPTGHPDTEGGLYLAAGDLAKIGQLYLDDGVWQGKRLLPPGWAKEATARHVANIDPNNTSSPGYGYQWWRYDRRGVDVWAGNGFGGQFLVVIPQYRLVGVANSWNVFGDRVPSVLAPFIDAMLDAAGVPAPAPPSRSPQAASSPSSQVSQASPASQHADTIRVGSNGLSAAMLKPGIDSSRTYSVRGNDKRLIMTYIEETRHTRDGVLIVGRNVTPAGATMSLDSVMLAPTLAPRWHWDKTPEGSARVTYENGRLRGEQSDTAGMKTAIDAEVHAGAFDYSMASRLLGYLPLANGYSGVLATHDITRGPVYTPFRVVGEERIDVDGKPEDTWKVEMTIAPTRTVTRWISKRTHKDVRIHVPVPGGLMVVE